MQLSKLLAIQVVIMFLLAAIGFILFKAKKIDKNGSKALGNILIYVSLPIVIFKSFLVERTTERLIGLGISSLAALITLIIGIIISRLLNRKDPIAAFACSFGNPGFFGVPLIVGAISSEAVFYIASYIAILNVMQWTYGVFLITKDKKDISLKKIITAPALIAFVLGIIFFFINIEMPAKVIETLNLLGNINTPIAMFTIGIYLAQTDILKMFARFSNYKVTIIKLILLAILFLLLLSVIPNTYYDLKIVMLIACACPVGSNIAVLAEMSNGDYPYAVETVVISSLFSIITIPLLVMLADFLWTGILAF